MKTDKKTTYSEIVLSEMSTGATLMMADEVLEESLKEDGWVRSNSNKMSDLLNSIESLHDEAHDVEQAIRNIELSIESIGNDVADMIA